MKRITELSFVAATAATVILSGTLYAHADWITTTPTTTLRVSTVTLPMGPRPSAEVHAGSVQLGWDAKDIAPGFRPQEYVVRRHGGGRVSTACVVRTPGCRDPKAPSGTWTYTIQLRYETWAGPEGPASTPALIANSAAVPVDATSVEPTSPIPTNSDTPPAGTASAGTGSSDDRDVTTTLVPASPRAAPSVDPAGERSADPSADLPDAQPGGEAAQPTESTAAPR